MERSSLLLSSHLPTLPYRDTSIYSRGCACHHRQLCLPFSFHPSSAFPCLSLNPLSGGLGLSHFAFEICLFTPRATLPHLKCYLSSTECFGAVPHVNTRLFFSSFPPLRKKTNASYLLLMLRRSLNSYFRGKKGAPDPVIVTMLFPRILRQFKGIGLLSS